MNEPTRLAVCIRVADWSDATVNGQDDNDGTMIPFRHGPNWMPVINLSTGKIIDWPAGVSAEIHYGCRGSSSYLLTDEKMRKIAEWPNSALRTASGHLWHGCGGLGDDFIDMTIDESGQIDGWIPPALIKYRDGDL